MPIVPFWVEGEGGDDCLQDTEQEIKNRPRARLQPLKAPPHRLTSVTRAFSANVSTAPQTAPPSGDQMFKQMSLRVCVIQIITASSFK